MNKWTLTAALALTAFAASASPALAAGEHKDAKTEERKKHEEQKQRMLEKYDANRDGVLSEEEKAAARADKGKHKGEKNREQKKQEEQKKREEQKQRMLEKYDTNKDGVLSEEEKAAARADRGNKDRQKGEKSPARK